MIESELLFAITLDVDEPQDFGATPVGTRRVVVVTGGRFDGPNLSGTVRPGGADWLLLRADGSWQLDVRLTLLTDDGALIGMTYRGLRHGPPEVMERLNRGEAVDSSEYYFRVAPRFETASEKYAWLNGILAVGVGTRTPEGPSYQVYRIL